MTTKFHSTQDEGDPLFADLVEEISALVDAGQMERAEALINQHSKYADSLRRLLPAMEALVSLDEVPEKGVDAAKEPTDRLGDFRIIREIGRGGMGVVYEAEQLSLGRRVALKVLPFAAMLDKQQLRRFKNEARAAATLDHPHIVAVHSVGEDRGVHHYAMQLVEGQSLAEVISARRRSSEIAADDPVGSDQAPTVEHHSSNMGQPEHVVVRGVPAGDTGPIAALSTVPDFDTTRRNTSAPSPS